jgi:hypothetical protein
LQNGDQYHKLIGATASDVRASMIEDFNKPDSDVFLFILSTRAGGQVLCCVCVCVCARARARLRVVRVVCAHAHCLSPSHTHSLFRA